MRGAAQRFEFSLTCVCIGIGLATVAGCALRGYQPAPLDPAASARAFESRTSDVPGLRQYMLAHGYAGAWPVQSWGLPELTLLAFYYHPDLQVARARVAAARAEAAIASQRAMPTVTPLLEHHSASGEGQTSPWSVGFEVEIPLGGSSRRAALRERHAHLADAAALRVGSAAWEVRARLRLQLVDYFAALREADLLDEELREKQALVKLLERRVQLGALSATEAGSASLALAETQSRLRTARAAQERALTGLAKALAMPLPAVRQVVFDFAAFDRLEKPPPDSQAQRAALLNRVDLRSQLLEYAAADADVKLEVARQYPSFALRPGYLWDQGDNIWSLALGVLLPPALGNRAGIEAAEARRALAAQEFMRLQNQTIAQAEGARAVYANLTASVAAAEDSSALQRTQLQQQQKRFDAGYADRVELTQARLQAAAASRAALAARVDALRAQGELEDALQAPLAGAPLPSVPVDSPSLQTSTLTRQ